MQSQNSKDSSVFIMDYLNEAFPNKLPLGQVTEFELGELLGQQEVINKLKHKLNIIQEKEMEEK